MCLDIKLKNKCLLLDIAKSFAIIIRLGKYNNRYELSYEKLLFKGSLRFHVGTYFITFLFRYGDCNCDVDGYKFGLKLFVFLSKRKYIESVKLCIIPKIKF